MNIAEVDVSALSLPHYVQTKMLRKNSFARSNIPQNQNPLRHLPRAFNGKAEKLV